MPKKLSNTILEIKIVCRFLLHRLDQDEEEAVQTLCLKYLSNEFYEPFYIASISKQSETGLIVAYSMLVGVALLLNILALFLSCVGKYKTSHSFMVLSLITGDFLLLCFCIPFNMSTIVTPFWENNNFRCKLVSYMQNVAVFAVILTPVAISIDRYLAIYYPIRFRSKVNKGRNFIMLSLIWAIA
ncbi:hypothetical protein HELRODRAFT_70554, partial [Helobdella robusta]|uniref:G-protein coupled receptors family 1 profile domain-containing protein n=1 Tax=Helobdella robusta TaxID=6412 RepID=T1G083_HELRO